MTAAATPACSTCKRAPIAKHGVRCLATGAVVATEGDEFTRARCVGPTSGNGPCKKGALESTIRSWRQYITIAAGGALFAFALPAAE